MPLASTHRLQQLSARHAAALGCCSVYNLETIQAVVQAAELERAPVLLSIDTEAVAHAGLTQLGPAALLAAREARVPVGVHLNHCRSLDTLLLALDLGFPSVMFDGSHLPLEENILHTRRAAQLAHASGADMEGEVGPLPAPGADGGAFLAEALRFLQETEVDILAVSLPKDGTVDLELLERLSATARLPVCIHGASRLGPEGAALVKARGAGKVNFHSELKAAFLAGLDSPGANALERCARARRAVRELVREKLAALGARDCCPPESLPPMLQTAL